MAMTKIQRRQRIRYRIRKVVNGTPERPRMSVFRSNKQIYVQVIDDTKGITLVSAGSNDKSLAEAVKGKTATEVAALVGKLIAERAVEKGISTVSSAEATSITEELKVWQTQPARAVLNSKRLWQISTLRK